jgi:ADP-heptose:LPS heptosyltransferase
MGSRRRLRRVLLVRSDGIGDALALTPLVAALRDAGHTLGAVLSTRNRDVFAPGTFERVHVLERIPWPRHGSTPETYGRALADARSGRYDVALIASEEPEAYRFARAAGIPVRVGFTNGLEKPLKSAWCALQLTRTVARPASARKQFEHEVEALFRLGRGLHDEAFPTRDVARLRPLVAGAGVPPHGRVVVQLTPKFYALGLRDDALHGGIRALAQSVPVVGVAGPAEADVGRGAASASGIDVVVTESLEQWKALIAGARAVVTPDGGAAHVAGMTGAGCIDLFPDGPDVASALQRWYPWASRTWTIAVTPRVAESFAEQLIAGVGYVTDASPVPGITAVLS